MAVTTSSGDGFALYNGVKLPNIDSVWDKETYPYAYMEVSDFSQFGVNAVVYSLDLFDKPLVFDVDEMRGYAPCAYKSCLFVRTQAELDAFAAAGMPLPAHGIWLEDGIVYTVEDENSYTPRPNTDTGFAALWTSYDVLSVADNSVYFAGSDPIPLDGYTVIEWDGDTTGLTTIDMSADGLNLYKISAETPVLDELYGGTVVSLASGTVPIDDTTSFQMSETLYVAGNYLYIALSDNTVFGSYTFLEKGIYSPKMVDGSDYVTILAYPESGGDGDDEDDDEGDTAPALKHYCCINGTVYEIKSGTAKMGGTFCEVKNGTVLIDGTVYDFALN